MKSRAEEVKREVVAPQTEPNRQRDLIKQFQTTDLYLSMEEKLRAEFDKQPFGQAMWCDDGQKRSLLTDPIEHTDNVDGEYWGEVNNDGQPHGFGVWVDNGKI